MKKVLLHTGGYLYILLSASLWGISGTIAKSLFTGKIDPLIIVQTRVTFAFLILLPILVLFYRKALVVNLLDLKRFMLLGIVGIAGPTFTYYYSIYLTTVATGILLQYMSTFIVLVFGIIFMRESNTWYKWTALIISMTGCYFAVGGLESENFQINRLGLFLGILSALTFAFLTIYGKMIYPLYDQWTVLFYSFGCASLFWLFVSPPWKVIAQEYPPADWLIFVGFSIISVLAPYYLYFCGLRYLQASRAIIVSTLEPIIAIVTAFIFLGELMSKIQIAGGAMVIGAIIFLQSFKEETPENT